MKHSPVPSPSKPSALARIAGMKRSPVRSPSKSIWSAQYSFLRAAEARGLAADERSTRSSTESSLASEPSTPDLAPVPHLVAESALDVDVSEEAVINITANIVRVRSHKNSSIKNGLTTPPSAPEADPQARPSGVSGWLPLSPAAAALLPPPPRRHSLNLIPPTPPPRQCRAKAAADHTAAVPSTVPSTETTSAPAPHDDFPSPPLGPPLASPPMALPTRLAAFADSPDQQRDAQRTTAPSAPLRPPLHAANASASATRGESSTCRAMAMVVPGILRISLVVLVLACAVRLATPNPPPPPPPPPPLAWTPRKFLLAHCALAAAAFAVLGTRASTRPVWTRGDRLRPLACVSGRWQPVSYSTFRET